MIQPEIIVVPSIFCSVCAVIWARMHYRHVERMAAHSPSRSIEGDERLARLEQAVDSIALEIERIGEGQRFLTRSLVRPTGGDPLPEAITGGSVERVLPDRR